MMMETQFNSSKKIRLRHPAKLQTWHMESVAIISLFRRLVAQPSYWALAFCILLLLNCRLLEAQNTADSASTVDANHPAIADFDSRVNGYLKLQMDAGSGIPSLKKTSSADKIAEYQHALADRIRALRPLAKQGDVFSPAIAAEFKRRLLVAYRGSNGERVSKSLRDAEPVKDIPVRVDAAYPERIPVQSTPPSILRHLPLLPPELDYRIVGHTLVLRDVKANLIVDYISGAIPAI